VLVAVLASRARTGNHVLMTNSVALGAEPEKGKVSSGQSIARLRQRGLAVCAGGIAFAAFVGAIGATAGLDLISRPFRRRLPFRSPVLGAGALVVVVGMPSVVAAQYAWRGDERADLAAMTAGGLTLGWIAFETTVVREPSLFDVVSGGAAIAMIVAGIDGIWHRRQRVMSLTANDARGESHARADRCSPAAT